MRRGGTSSDYLNAIDRKQQGAYIESINDIAYLKKIRGVNWHQPEREAVCYHRRGPPSPCVRKRLERRRPYGQTKRDPVSLSLDLRIL